MMYEGGILAELTNGELRRSGPINNDNGQIVWHESDVDGLNDRILLWESGAAIPLVTEEDVAGSSISNSGDISYVAWNETKALYELKVYRASDQLVFTLPSVGFSHSGGWAGMNECGELVWRASPPEGGPPTLFMLRRTSPQGDFDHDCRIDAYDFSILEDCFTGSGVEPGGGLLADCTRADFDDDGDVDETDVSAFLEAAGGPAAPVPDCQAIALCGS
jgi:hypothetical protein